MIEKALIIFGTTGSLVRKKIFPALASLQDGEKLDKNLTVIGYGRKDFDQKPLNNFTYIKGELTDLSGIVDYIKDQSVQEIFFLVALPPSLYAQMIELIQKYFKGKNIRIALEKPFGSSFESAVTLAEEIKKYGEDGFYLIDHYLAKQSVINFPKLPKERRDPKNIIGFEASIFETGDVSERGALFDELGAIKDTGQNHVLNVAASFFEGNDRISFLKNLKYKEGSRILGQYEGYLNTPGVKPNSNTETYFKADFIYKGINVTLRSGKALNETRVFINVNYKDGKNLYIEVSPNQIITPSIIPWPKEENEAHKHVIEDFLKGNKFFSLTTGEAIESWKVVDLILSDKGEPSLRIYSPGAGSEDIEKS